MEKYLFLDDERKPSDVVWVRIPRGVPWHIVRSCSEAVQWVKQNGFPNVISFDHDLADNYTGMDFAKWLVNYDMDTNTMPEDFIFYVHSMNPIGAENIKRYLGNYIRTKNSTNPDK